MSGVYTESNPLHVHVENARNHVVAARVDDLRAFIRLEIDAER